MSIQGEATAVPSLRSRPPSLSPSEAPSRPSTLFELLRVKNIGKFGSVCFIYGSILGPGVPQIQAAFQQYGWFTTTLFFLAFAIISTLGSLFIVEAMQCIPGNRHFQGTIEFGTLINFYFGRRFYIVGQFFLHCSLVAAGAVSIIQAVQTMDSIIVDILRYTCGIGIGDGTKGWICVPREFATQATDQYFHYGNEIMLMTAGALVMMLIIIPLTRQQLNENIYVQIVSFIVTIAVFSFWVGISIQKLVTSGPEAPVPMFGPVVDFGGAFGPIMMNYAYITVIPSWVNLKDRHINIQRTLWESSSMAFFTYLFVGLIPALAFHIDDNSNLLLVLSSKNNLLYRIAGYVYVLLVLIASIPVFMIVSHHNLVQNKAVSPLFGKFLSFAVPWIVAIPCLSGPLLIRLTDWSGLVFIVITNMIIPFLIYLRAVKFRRVYNRTRELSPQQKELLREIHWPSKTILKFLDRLPSESPDGIASIGRTFTSFMKRTLSKSKNADAPIEPTEPPQPPNAEHPSPRAPYVARQNSKPGRKSGASFELPQMLKLPSLGPSFDLSLRRPPSSPASPAHTMATNPDAISPYIDDHYYQNYHIHRHCSPHDCDGESVNIDEMLDLFGDVVDPDRDDDAIPVPDLSPPAVISQRSHPGSSTLPSSAAFHDANHARPNSCEYLQADIPEILISQADDTVAITTPIILVNDADKPMLAQEAVLVHPDAVAAPEHEQPQSDLSVPLTTRTESKKSTTSSLGSGLPALRSPSLQTTPTHGIQPSSPLGLSKRASESSLKPSDAYELVRQVSQPASVTARLSIASGYSLRPGSLPIHPEYTTPVFRVLPRKFPIPGVYVAYISLVITLTVTIWSLYNLSRNL
ncbi:uncharacterized protein BJ171DRAFT_506959 [Polychytrium aggregatum]|uniref:uncharacterized protein n=1 Tax=Polychytrium aggregatum TaxID=110093 RepID=UPI0022FE8F62|nr:uncharacterized protein BJ171DRAFT_506959 [Polychytrium aggregatum]KAI9204310.1 hypothetical protein BJ171DRAFT_506959 [Polychytrium aggregatum]